MNYELPMPDKVDLKLMILVFYFRIKIRGLKPKTC